MFRPSGPDHMLIRTVKFCLFSLSLLFQEVFTFSSFPRKWKSMQNQKTKYNKSQNESLQNSESSPEFLEKRPAPQGQIPSPPTPRAPPRWESSSFAVSKCQATQLEGVSPGCTMQSLMVLVKTKEPGHLHWRAKVVAKENSDSQGWLLVTWEQELLQRRTPTQGWLLVTCCCSSAAPSSTPRVLLLAS